MARTLALPLQVAPRGGLATRTQGEVGEIGQSVALLLSTCPGERRSVPDYGLPDPVFGGLEVDTVAETVRIWEDRADRPVVDLAVSGAFDHASVALTATFTGETETDDEPRLDASRSDFNTYPAAYPATL